MKYLISLAGGLNVRTCLRARNKEINKNRPKENRFSIFNENSSEIDKKYDILMRSFDERFKFLNLKRRKIMTKKINQVAQDVAENVIKIREGLELNQAKFAKKIGVKLIDIKKIESGKTTPS